MGGNKKIHIFEIMEITNDKSVNIVMLTFHKIIRVLNKQI